MFANQTLVSQNGFNVSSKNMKLIVQIPCFNEERTLPQTVRDIPREIPGIDCVEILVIDDGSTDRTVEVAREIGVEHVVRNKKNLGLARTFRNGVDACLNLGADIIVNTDGDNQYYGPDIARLVEPIVAGRADMVIGNRETDKITHFSRGKKYLQWFGSGVVRKLAGIWVPDAVSGFRAFSRDFAISLNIVSSFSYTIETVIEAGQRGFAVESVTIHTNPKTRDSRLFKSVLNFIGSQLSTIVRMYTMYQPMRVFFLISAALTLLGIVPILRFLFIFFTGDGSGHLQSLVLGGVLVTLGAATFLIGLVADLTSFNRQLLEITLEHVKRLELQQSDRTRSDA